MRMTPPMTIRDHMLLSASVSEPGVGEVAWASGSTYATRDKVIVGKPSSTVTITVASPGVITWTANGLPDGTPVTLSTTGALPTGLTAGQLYFIVNRSTNTFQLSEEADGEPIVTTGSQSGTHTATAYVHRRYMSLIDANSGNPPALDDGQKWRDIGPTNLWAAFDLDRNTPTVGASPLTFVLKPGQRFNAFGVDGLVADQIDVSIESGGVEVYSYTEKLNVRPTTGWYSYFHGQFRQKRATALYDLPAYTDAEVTITATRAVGLVSVGGLLLGMSVWLGDAQVGAESDTLNASKITRDAYNNVTLIRRPAVPANTMQVFSPKANINSVREARDALGYGPAMWSWLEDVSDDYFEIGHMLGIARRWKIAADANHFVQQIDLEGV